MALSNSELLRKATLTTTDMVGQGVSLTIEQATSFLRLAITPQVMMPDVRTVSSAAATWQEARIDFANRVLRPGVQATRLADSDRVEPQVNMISMTTVLLKGEVPVSDEVLEDNIEQQGFGNTIMTMLAEAVGRDIEDLMINGDTASADPYYALYDGWLKLSQAGNVVDATANGQDYQSTFIQMIQALPAKYKQDKANMRFYVPLRLDENYRTALAGRGSPLGDALLMGTQPLMFQDVAIVPVPLFPVAGSSTFTSKILLTHRLNLYAGFHRQVRIETWRDPREGATSWVVTVRCDAKMGWPAAVVVANNVSV